MSAWTTSTSRRQGNRRSRTCRRTRNRLYFKYYNLLLLYKSQTSTIIISLPQAFISAAVDLNMIRRAAAPKNGNWLANTEGKAAFFRNVFRLRYVTVQWWQAGNYKLKTCCEKQGTCSTPSTCSPSRSPSRAPATPACARAPLPVCRSSYWASRCSTW